MITEGILCYAEYTHLQMVTVPDLFREVMKNIFNQAFCLKTFLDVLILTGLLTFQLLLNENTLLLWVLVQ